jgi:hypothetical protein
MSKNLENFMEQNKDAFNEYEPSAKLWDKLEADLKINNVSLHEKAAVRKINMYKWVAAASVTLLIGGGIFFFSQKNIEQVQPSFVKQHDEQKAKESITIKDTLEIPTAPIQLKKEEGFIVKQSLPKDKKIEKIISDKPENNEMLAFNESKEHFAKLITYKGNEIKKLAKNDPEVYKNFSEDIAELNETYKQLNKQLPKTNNKSALINAMIYNLQVQIDLLNKQLIILNKIETIKKKKDYENNI